MVNSILKDSLPQELQTRLDLIIQTVPKYWEQRYQHFTYQGVTHSQYVHRRVIDITRQLPDQRSLSTEEFFVLSAASWLYETGLQSPNLKPILEFEKQLVGESAFSQILQIRSKKHLLTEKLIIDSLDASYRGMPIYLGLTHPIDDYIRCVAEVCRWCSDETLDNVPEERAVNGQSVRLRLLVAILRLADKLYINGKRVNQSILPNFNLPSPEFARWAIYPYVQSLPIEKNQIRFSYSLPNSMARFLGNIRALIESSFQHETSELRFLWEHDLHLILHNTPIITFDRFEGTSTVAPNLIAVLQETAPAKPTSIEHTGKMLGNEPVHAIIFTEEEERTNGLKISASLLTRTFPSAYCRNLDATSFPFVTIHIDNGNIHSQLVSLRISAIIEDYSDIAVTTIDVLPGKQTSISLLPLLKLSQLADLNEIRRTSLRITVEQLFPQNRILYDKSELIFLQARNSAVVGISKSDGSIIDLADYLAAWVTPRHPEIEQWLRRAADHHPEKQLVGYQGAKTLEEARIIVSEQARAIFNMLKQEAHITYINSTLNLGGGAGYIEQRIRLPRESLHAGGSANCIDGTVLFASFLELATIDPLIVIIPGHAFVGWRIWEETDIYEFLETTMIKNGDFEVAHKVAQDRFDEIIFAGYLKNNMFDNNGFARIVDIANCRKNGIYPME